MRNKISFRISRPGIFRKTGETPANTREEFKKECAGNNRVPALIIVSMALGMECLMAFFYILNFYILKKGQFFLQYIYMYTSMIIACLCFFAIYPAVKHQLNKLMRLELAVVVILGVWSAVFSAFDVINGFSSYLFIQLMIINSLLFKLNPVTHCSINIFCYLLYMAIILNARLGITVTFAELVNPFFMIVAACIIIVLNDRTGYKTYVNQNLIKEQNKKLEFYANNDFLTRIPNRKDIIEYLDEMILSKKNIVCMMIDIDNFKLYNDTYGHIEGDTCLIKLSSAIEKYVVLQGGKVGRYGGEEFLVLLSDKKEDDAVAIANGLVRIVREQNIEFSTNKDGKAVTISAGVHIQRDTKNMDRVAILVSADQALYQAKKEGKNRISVSYC